MSGRILPLSRLREGDLPRVDSKVGNMVFFRWGELPLGIVPLRFSV